MSFISAFGAVKSVMNLVSGRLSDRRGRKSPLLVGWAFALPYALIIIFATAWWQVIVANLFLGVNQALTSTVSVTAAPPVRTRRTASTNSRTASTMSSEPLLLAG